MTKIPKDVDDLMWELAECGDGRATEEFVQRYPQYRAELIKRTSMVSGLKGAKKEQKPAPNIPKFTPRQTYQPVSTPRWIPAAACLLLAIVAYASYRITAGYVSEASKPRYITVKSNEALPTKPDRIIQKQPEPNVGKIAEGDEKPVGEAAEKPITIKIDRAPLISVLDMVAAESGLILEVGPNMANPDIKMEYSNVPGSKILADLGKAFGFTALKEGDKRYLIIPATDPNMKSAPEPRLGIAQVLDAPAAPQDPSEAKNN